MNSSYNEIKKYCDEHGVTLVAVSKTKTQDEILEVYEQGQIIFGENIVQELIPKYVALPKDIQWHLIGHLQTNKVKSILPFVSLIHSVDSWKLYNEINEQVKKMDTVTDVLFQIHIAREESKFGMSYEKAKMILLDSHVLDFSRVRIRGLMGIASLTDDEEQIRREFRGLKKFFDEMKIELSDSKFETLSMGMSSDYKIAIEEGSTMVRIGSAIFGQRMKSSSA